MASKRDTGAGVSWYDVKALLLQLNDEYIGRHVLEIEALKNGSGTYERLSVTAASFVGQYRTPRNTIASVGASFPSKGHRTLVGCCFQLIYTLESELERARQARQTPPPTAGNTLLDLLSTTDNAKHGS